MSIKMNLGPVMLDLKSTTISETERKLLLHPNTGGVILFSRNYENKTQLKQLCTEIHALRQPALLIAVDHEGGRVQRFKEGFSLIPPMAAVGKEYNSNPKQALQDCFYLAWLMAYELIECQLDFSFAPVLDINIGLSKVIGDRAFHNTATGVTEMAKAWIKGMHHAGMATVAKHFPGHGSVEPDSHLEIPVDNRSFLEIEQHDLIPFSKIKTLDAIMPAHVVYSKIDQMPAGFSTIWLQEILKKQLKFKGVIFSDDLSMAGAKIIGDYNQRAKQALAAGCDVVLICNNQDGAVAVVENLEYYQQQQLTKKLSLMRSKPNKNNLLVEAKRTLQTYIYQTG